MSLGEPFILRSLGSLLFQYEWSDWGTGGRDWSFMSVTTKLDGYAPLGDLVYDGHLGDNVRIDPNRAWNIQVLYVRNNRPDVAKPCTDYMEVASLGPKYHSKLWRPTHSDPNYIGVGDICYRGLNKPPVGRYYCLHRKYLLDAGKNAPLFFNEDGLPCYRTIANTNIFRKGDTQLFGLRDDASLQACCTGSGAACEIWTKGSTACQNAMTEYCAASDIKPGGKCEDWCTRDPIGCDKVKNKFCDEHPNDPFCDCINAFNRPEHAALIKDKETIYSMSIPACYFDKCKQGPYKVFTTTEMTEAQQGQRCSQDLKYIDQQIKVLGDNNILNSSQNVNENQTNIEPPKNSKDSTIAGFQSNKVLIFIFLIIAIVVGYYAFFKQDEVNYNMMPPMMQPPMMQPPMMQPMMPQPMM
jgi:hypothetical protein